MPDRDKLNFVLGNAPEDLSKVRLEGLEKPFEELTISELVQLRPGSEVADTYEINAVTDNVSVTNSSMLSELGRIQGLRSMQQVVDQSRLDGLRSRMLPQLRATSFRPSSAEPAPDEVRLGGTAEDAFEASGRDPFEG